MIDLTANPNEPRLKAAERIATACHELHAAHLRTGWFDERGYWFPNEPREAEAWERTE